MHGILLKLVRGTITPPLGLTIARPKPPWTLHATRPLGFQVGVRIACAGESHRSQLIREERAPRLRLASRFHARRTASHLLASDANVSRVQSR